MFALITSQLIWLYLNISLADHLSIALVFLLFVAGWRQLKTREAYLVGVCLVLAAIAYFSFQVAAQAIWGPLLPSAPTPGPLEWALIVIAVISFGMVAFAQALFPLWAHHPSTAGLRVHLANGLYLNALLDRAIGGFAATKSNSQ